MAVSQLPLFVVEFKALHECEGINAADYSGLP
jgi:hypothetical protein